MFIVGILSWWYGRGWREEFRDFSQRVDGLMDYFSFDLLLRTFFSPFRQISAGRVRGPLGVQLRAWLDRLVSRVIGAMVRSFVLLAGVVALVVYVVVGLLIVLLWAVVPLLPLVGLGLTLVGWTPWTN